MLQPVGKFAEKSAIYFYSINYIKLACGHSSPFPNPEGQVR